MRHEWYSDSYVYGTGVGRRVRPVDTADPGTPLVPPDTNWDPVEELAYLLQEAVPAEQAATVPPPRSEPPSGADFSGADFSGADHSRTDYSGADHSDPMENLAQITAQLPPLRRSSAGHRKIRVRRFRFKWLQAGSFVIVAFVAVIVAMVSVFSGVVAYGPLQNIPSGSQGGVIPWWPLLVYGPWAVASLSILRTALHQRRALHSWFIVLLFSSVAMALCVAQADRTFTGVAGAALPAVACLACLQQLVRQITLTLPPRKGAPRHRQ
ncbi:DUF2637 domain-containing protein [Streptomyces sp. NPDC017936]|uniref:DUF2637 domain-containing protein n=1 Tax=Streptomyces sp. NPDC017936 TaxID=3365016 RepID=UPI00379B6939